MSRSCRARRGVGRSDEDGVKVRLLDPFDQPALARMFLSTEDSGEDAAGGVCHVTVMRCEAGIEQPRERKGSWTGDRVKRGRSSSGGTGSVDEGGRLSKGHAVDLRAVQTLVSAVCEGRGIDGRTPGILLLCGRAATSASVPTTIQRRLSHHDASVGDLRSSKWDSHLKIPLAESRRSRLESCDRRALHELAHESRILHFGDG